MVVPWIGYIIWKNWVIHVLVFLVFQVFSTAELISLAKTVNLAVWAFSLIFLHDFTLFGIDMHNIYHISSISTTFGPLWNMGFPGPDPNLHLALCHVLFLVESWKSPYNDDDIHNDTTISSSERYKFYSSWVPATFRQPGPRWSASRTSSHLSALSACNWGGPVKKITLYKRSLIPSPSLCFPESERMGGC